MAVTILTDLIGEALIDAVRQGHERIISYADAAAEWLKEAARPPDGVELTSTDGCVYTGLVLVERSRVVLMLAARHPATRAPERSPIITPPPRQENRTPFSHRYLDPDDGRWDRDGDPFRR